MGAFGTFYHKRRLRGEARVVQNALHAGDVVLSLGRLPDCPACNPSALSRAACTAALAQLEPCIMRTSSQAMVGCCLALASIYLGTRMGKLLA